MNTSYLSHHLRRRLRICLTTFALFLSVGNSALGQSSYDTNRGFVHPGGLHTQADFDRIKQQLAAGNTTVKAAYAKLTSAAYAQASVKTNPVETIVRGGGSGENYMNACRGAAMAYQNALRWKIAGTKANAEAAVRILMDWAHTTKNISGDSNYALASGLYGYEFAQAAELMRDYEGWSREDFEVFKSWMLTVWYPKAIGFLRGRNGTWENTGKWWQAPGHYWSNWGLCNTLCVALIGILCDDVFIYNQAMSYFKYDQCGTYKDKRTEVPIKNDGLTEFLGNLVVTTAESDLETGAYGMLGQMNESGRDTGHSAMALGLAIDMAKIGWSQGDDLFAYMDHRLAAGIEYVAAQTQSVENLPWTNYQYGSSGYYYTDSRAWIMEGPALGAQMRPYWGSVIGIYEGVKGVTMPFSEASYKDMGIDAGGQGSTSGGYDHLGYSVLMNTRDEQLCAPEKVPTELTPKMEYSGTLSTNLIPSLAQEKSRKLVDGSTICHNELGGLVNTFAVNNTTCVPAGKTLKLMPQLPEGEEDTGLWTWDTGETTRDITVTSDRSFIYRVTYTNSRGIQSQLSFAIAVDADCVPDVLIPSATAGGVSADDPSSLRVLYGRTATLSVAPSAGFGTYKWTGNKTTQSITTSALKKSQDISVEYKNQGGAVTPFTFHIDVMAAQPYASVGEEQVSLCEDETPAIGEAQLIAPHVSLACEPGDSVTLGLTLPSSISASKVVWSNGESGATMTLPAVEETGTYMATFTLAGEQVEIAFEVLVHATEPTAIEPGNYRLMHVATNTYLTAHGKNQLATFESQRDDDGSQIWFVNHNSAPKYAFYSLADTDSLQLNALGKTAVTTYYPFYLEQASEADRIAIHTSTTSNGKYWDVADDSSILTAAANTLTAFPFQLIAVGSEDGLKTLTRPSVQETLYDLSGRQITSPRKGVYIQKGKKKIFLK
ncbi:MAG: alginate lyase family protein [Bacteroidaceae bacterium]|nr:alginate lyase family protein [Bacteroidaceae bacterium]